MNNNIGKPSTTGTAATAETKTTAGMGMGSKGTPSAAIQSPTATTEASRAASSSVAEFIVHDWGTKSTPA